MDRYRVVGFTEGYAIIEARGDELLQGQLRAIVGTAVAMANGWLPSDTVQKSTDKDIIVAMPLAPAGRAYLADVKFHFEEMRTGGKRLFESPVALLSLSRNPHVGRYASETVCFKSSTNPK